MSTNFSIQRQAQKDKLVAELKLQSVSLRYQAALLSDDMEAEGQCRAEIHALQDIVLDSLAVMFRCAKLIDSGCP